MGLRKIGVLSLNTYINYGNRFQIYAISEILKCIDKDIHIDILILDFGEKPNKKKKKSLLLERRKERIKTFKEFSFRYLNEKIIYGDNKYKIEEISRYDYIIIGSDQVFNPTLKYPYPFDFCNFLQSEKIITISPSFGREFKDIEAKYYKTFKKGLDNILIENLTVREYSGAEIILKLVGRYPKITLDPCLYLGRKKWDNLCNTKIRYDNIIFTYFLNQRKVNKDVINYIDKLAEKENLKVVNINNPKDDLFAEGPETFLTLLKNAKYVITNSFHGLCFSLIFEKKFIACDIVTNLSVQSRIDNLLKIFNLNDRKFENIKNIESEIDYTEIKNKLNSERITFTNYLFNALDMR